VRFWDASALVPLCLAQPATERMRALHKKDHDVVVWWGSVVECASAIARVERSGELAPDAAAAARAVLADLRATWYEMQPDDILREQALRLLRIHPLRSADALQLAAAIEWAGSPPSGGFVALDDRLRTAAEREGFDAA
jgi:uncharacterized protein